MVPFSNIIKDILVGYLLFRNSCFFVRFKYLEWPCACHMAHLLNLLILSIGPGINSLIIVLRGNWARRAESRRLVIGGYRQWIEHILTIQNKLNNISEVYITSVIWSRLMETYKQDFYSLRAIWHAQGKFCVNILPDYCFVILIVVFVHFL